MSAILLISVIGVVLLIVFGYLISDSLNAKRQLMNAANLETKKIILQQLYDQLVSPVILKNSRFDVNSVVYNCIQSPTMPCDESVLSDFLIYPPTPVIPFNGIWGPAPAGFYPIVGGYNANPVFYNSAGGLCPPSTTASGTECPIRFYARIQPLCGGTPENPQIATAPSGGPCAGQATGFKIIMGVGSLISGTKTMNFSPNDEKEMVVPVSLFTN